jgi:hypothetical protein
MTTTIRNTGLAALAALAATLPFQYVVGNARGEDGGAWGMLLVFAVCAAVAAWLLARFVPRALAAGPETAARRGLVVGALGLLSVLVFFTGLPLVLGPVAIALGVLSRERQGGGAATVAIVLGALAVAGAVGVTLLDELG